MVFVDVYPDIALSVRAQHIFQASPTQQHVVLPELRSLYQTAEPCVGQVIVPLYATSKGDEFGLIVSSEDSLKAGE